MDLHLLTPQDDDPAQVEVVEHFGVGAYRQEAAGPAFEIVEHFSRENYQRYAEAVNKVLGLGGHFTVTLVERNFQSYLDHQKFAATLIELGRAFGSADRLSLAEALMGQIVNWLTSFRLFLDHAETALKRRYGSDSAPVHLFLRRTSEAFDQHLGYRFVCKFRNYVQHCGAPISSLDIGRVEGERGNPHIRQQVSFQLSRTHLLSSFDWGSMVRSDIESMDEKFDLGPLASEAMEQLRDIHRLLLDIAIEDAARTITDVRELLSMLPSDIDGLPTLFRFSTSSAESSEKITRITPSHIQVEAVEMLERVANGKLEPSALHSAPQIPPNPRFDPATVREWFRRDNRAVQIMSLWQAEGGGTADFEAQVNQMAREDRGIEPMFTGMLNITAVLLHMTATALGVQPEGLLGRMLDIYAATDDIGTKHDD